MAQRSLVEGLEAQRADLVGGVCLALGFGHRQRGVGFGIFGIGHRTAILEQVESADYARGERLGLCQPGVELVDGAAFRRSISARRLSADRIDRFHDSSRR